MEEDEEDDIYAPDESSLSDQKHTAGIGHAEEVLARIEGNGNPPEDEGSGEGSEEDESDSVR